jgi:SAM-dependent methyltransferase
MSPTPENFAHIRAGWNKAGLQPIEDAMHDVHRESDPESFYDSGEVFAAECVEALPPKTFPRIIELGAGLGRVTRHLQHHYEFVYAVDIAPSMVNHLRNDLYNGNLIEDRVRVVEDNGTTLGPVIAKPVDAVYSSLVLMHNTRAGVNAIFEALHRRIRPNGRIAFQLPVYDHPIHVSKWNYVAQWTRDEVEALAADNGYIAKTIHTNPGNYDVRRKWETIGPHHFDLHTFVRP